MGWSFLYYTKCRFLLVVFVVWCLILDFRTFVVLWGKLHNLGFCSLAILWGQVPNLGFCSLIILWGQIPNLGFCSLVILWGQIPNLGFCSLAILWGQISCLGFIRFFCLYMLRLSTGACLTLKSGLFVGWCGIMTRYCLRLCLLSRFLPFLSCPSLPFLLCPSLP